jgi:hypothetical protein
MKSRRPRRPAPSLQRFTLEELAPFTKEGTFASNASQDFHLFYVGRDDVHGILKYLLARATTSLYLNMFGYDDEELNQECMRCALDRSITTVITLDKSQSGGQAREGDPRLRRREGPGRVSHALRRRAVGDAPDQPHQGRRPRRAGGLRGVDQLVGVGGRNLPP